MLFHGVRNMSAYSGFQKTILKIARDAERLVRQNYRRTISFLLAIVFVLTMTGLDVILAHAFDYSYQASESRANKLETNRDSQFTGSSIENNIPDAFLDLRTGSQAAEDPGAKISTTSLNVLKSEYGNLLDTVSLTTLAERATSAFNLDTMVNSMLGEIGNPDAGSGPGAAEEETDATLPVMDPAAMMDVVDASQGPVSLSLEMKPDVALLEIEDTGIDRLPIPVVAINETDTGNSDTENIAKVPEGETEISGIVEAVDNQPETMDQSVLDMNQVEDAENLDTSQSQAEDPEQNNENQDQILLVDTERSDNQTGEEPADETNLIDKFVALVTGDSLKNETVEIDQTEQPESVSTVEDEKVITEQPSESETVVADQERDAEEDYVSLDEKKSAEDDEGGFWSMVKTVIKEDKGESGSESENPETDPEMVVITEHESNEPDVSAEVEDLVLEDSKPGQDDAVQLDVEMIEATQADLPGEETLQVDALYQSEISETETFDEDDIDVSLILQEYTEEDSQSEIVSFSEISPVEEVVAVHNSKLEMDTDLETSMVGPGEMIDLEDVDDEIHASTVTDDSNLLFTEDVLTPNDPMMASTAPLTGGVLVNNPAARVVTDLKQNLIQGSQLIFGPQSPGTTSPSFITSPTITKVHTDVPPQIGVAQTAPLQSIDMNLQMSTSFNPAINGTAPQTSTGPPSNIVDFVRTAAAALNGNNHQIPPLPNVNISQGNTPAWPNYFDSANTFQSTAEALSTHHIHHDPPKEKGGKGASGCSKFMASPIGKILTFIVMVVITYFTCGVGLTLLKVIIIIIEFIVIFVPLPPAISMVLSILTAVLGGWAAALSNLAKSAISSVATLATKALTSLTSLLKTLVTEGLAKTVWQSIAKAVVAKVIMMAFAHYFPDANPLLTTVVSLVAGMITSGVMNMIGAESFGDAFKTGFQEALKESIGMSGSGFDLSALVNSEVFKSLVLTGINIVATKLLKNAGYSDELVAVLGGLIGNVVSGVVGYMTDPGANDLGKFIADLALSAVANVVVTAYSSYVGPVLQAQGYAPAQVQQMANAFGTFLNKVIPQVINTNRTPRGTSAASASVVDRSPIAPLINMIKNILGGATTPGIKGNMAGIYGDGLGALSPSMSNRAPEASFMLGGDGGNLGNNATVPTSAENFATPSLSQQSNSSPVVEQITGLALGESLSFDFGEASSVHEQGMVTPSSISQTKVNPEVTESPKTANNIPAYTGPAKNTTQPKNETSKSEIPIKKPKFTKPETKQSQPIETPKEQVQKDISAKTKEGLDKQSDSNNRVEIKTKKPKPERNEVKQANKNVSIDDLDGVRRLEGVVPKDQGDAISTGDGAAGGNGGDGGANTANNAETQNKNVENNTDTNNRLLESAGSDFVSTGDAKANATDKVKAVANSNATTQPSGVQQLAKQLEAAGAMSSGNNYSYSQGQNPAGQALTKVFDNTGQLIGAQTTRADGTQVTKMFDQQTSADVQADTQLADNSKPGKGAASEQPLEVKATTYENGNIRLEQTFKIADGKLIETASEKTGKPVDAGLDNKGVKANQSKAEAAKHATAKRPPPKVGEQQKVIGMEGVSFEHNGAAVQIVEDSKGNQIQVKLDSNNKFVKTGDYRVEGTFIKGKERVFIPNGSKVGYGNEGGVYQYKNGAGGEGTKIKDECVATFRDANSEKHALTSALPVDTKSLPRDVQKAMVLAENAAKGVAVDAAGEALSTADTRRMGTEAVEILQKYAQSQPTGTQQHQEAMASLAKAEMGMYANNSDPGALKGIAKHVSQSNSPEMNLKLAELQDGDATQKEAVSSVKTAMKLADSSNMPDQQKAAFNLKAAEMLSSMDNIGQTQDIQKALESAGDFLSNITPDQVDANMAAMGLKLQNLANQLIGDQNLPENSLAPELGELVGEMMKDLAFKVSGEAAGMKNGDSQTASILNANLEKTKDGKVQLTQINADESSTSMEFAKDDQGQLQPQKMITQDSKGVTQQTFEADGECMNLTGQNTQLKVQIGQGDQAKTANVDQLLSTDRDAPVAKVAMINGKPHELVIQPDNTATATPIKTEAEKSAVHYADSIKGNFDIKINPDGSGATIVKDGRTYTADKQVLATDEALLAAGFSLKNSQEVRGKTAYIFNLSEVGKITIVGTPEGLAKNQYYITGTNTFESKGESIGYVAKYDGVLQELHLADKDQTVVQFMHEKSLFSTKTDLTRFVVTKTTENGNQVARAMYDDNKLTGYTVQYKDAQVTFAYDSKGVMTPESFATLNANSGEGYTLKKTANGFGLIVNDTKKEYYFSQEGRALLKPAGGESAGGGTQQGVEFDFTETMVFSVAKIENGTLSSQAVKVDTIMRKHILYQTGADGAMSKIETASTLLGEPVLQTTKNYEIDATTGTFRWNLRQVRGSKQTLKAEGVWPTDAATYNQSLATHQQIQMDGHGFYTTVIQNDDMLLSGETKNHTNVVISAKGVDTTYRATGTKKQLFEIGLPTGAMFKANTKMGPDKKIKAGKNNTYTMVESKKDKAISYSMSGENIHGAAVTLFMGENGQNYQAQGTPEQLRRTGYANETAKNNSLDSREQIVANDSGRFMIYENKGTDGTVIISMPGKNNDGEKVILTTRLTGEIEVATDQFASYDTSVTVGHKGQRGCNTTRLLSGNENDEVAKIEIHVDVDKRGDDNFDKDGNPLAFTKAITLNYNGTQGNVAFDQKATTLQIKKGKNIHVSSIKFIAKGKSVQTVITTAKIGSKFDVNGNPVSYTRKITMNQMEQKNEDGSSTKISNFSSRSVYEKGKLKLTTITGENAITNEKINGNKVVRIEKGKVDYTTFFNDRGTAIKRTGTDAVVTEYKYDDKGNPIGKEICISNKYTMQWNDDGKLSHRDSTKTEIKLVDSEGKQVGAIITSRQDKTDVKNWDGQGNPNKYTRTITMNGKNSTQRGKGENQETISFTKLVTTITMENGKETRTTTYTNAGKEVLNESLVVTERYSKEEAQQINSSNPDEKIKAGAPKNYVEKTKRNGSTQTSTWRDGKEKEKENVVRKGNFANQHTLEKRMTLGELAASKDNPFNSKQEIEKLKSFMKNKGADLESTLISILSDSHLSGDAPKQIVFKDRQGRIWSAGVREKKSVKVSYSRSKRSSSDGELFMYGGFSKTTRKIEKQTVFEITAWQGEKAMTGKELAVELSGTSALETLEKGMPQNAKNQKVSSLFNKTEFVAAYNDKGEMTEIKYKNTDGAVKTLGIERTSRMEWSDNTAFNEFMYMDVETERVTDVEASEKSLTTTQTKKHTDTITINKEPGLIGAAGNVAASITRALSWGAGFINPFSTGQKAVELHDNFINKGNEIVNKAFGIEKESKKITGKLTTTTTTNLEKPGLIKSVAGYLTGNRLGQFGSADKPTHTTAQFSYQGEIDNETGTIIRDVGKDGTVGKIAGFTPDNNDSFMARQGHATGTRENFAKWMEIRGDSLYQRISYAINGTIHQASADWLPGDFSTLALGTLSKMSYMLGFDEASLKYKTMSGYTQQRRLDNFVANTSIDFFSGWDNPVQKFGEIAWKSIAGAYTFFGVQAEISIGFMFGLALDVGAVFTRGDFKPLQATALSLTHFHEHIWETFKSNPAAAVAFVFGGGGALKSVFKWKSFKQQTGGFAMMIGLNYLAGELGGGKTVLTTWLALGVIPLMGSISAAVSMRGGKMKRSEYVGRVALAGVHSAGHTLTGGVKYVANMTGITFVRAKMAGMRINKICEGKIPFSDRVMSKIVSGVAKVGLKFLTGNKTSLASEKGTWKQKAIDYLETKREVHNFDSIKGEKLNMAKLDMHVRETLALNPSLSRSEKRLAVYKTVLSTLKSNKATYLRTLSDVKASSNAGEQAVGEKSLKTGNEQDAVAILKKNQPHTVHEAKDIFRNYEKIEAAKAAVQGQLAKGGSEALDVIKEFGESGVKSLERTISTMAPEAIHSMFFGEKSLLGRLFGGKTSGNVKDIIKALGKEKGDAAKIVGELMESKTAAKLLGNSDPKILKESGMLENMDIASAMEKMTTAEKQNMRDKFVKSHEIEGAARTEKSGVQDTKKQVEKNDELVDIADREVLSEGESQSGRTALEILLDSVPASSITRDSTMMKRLPPDLQTKVLDKAYVEIADNAKISETKKAKQLRDHEGNYPRAQEETKSTGKRALERRDTLLPDKITKDWRGAVQFLEALKLTPSELKSVLENKSVKEAFSELAKAADLATENGRNLEFGKKITNELKRRLGKSNEVQEGIAKIKDAIDKKIIERRDGELNEKSATEGNQNHQSGKNKNADGTLELNNVTTQLAQAEARVQFEKTGSLAKLRARLKVRELLVEMRDTFGSKDYCLAGKELDAKLERLAKESEEISTEMSEFTEKPGFKINEKRHYNDLKQQKTKLEKLMNALERQRKNLLNGISKQFKISTSESERLIHMGEGIQKSSEMFSATLGVTEADKSSKTETKDLNEAMNKLETTLKGKSELKDAIDAIHKALGKFKNSEKIVDKLTLDQFTDLVTAKSEAHRQVAERIHNEIKNRDKEKSVEKDAAKTGEKVKEIITLAQALKYSRKGLAERANQYLEATQKSRALFARFNEAGTSRQRRVLLDKMMQNDADFVQKIRESAQTRPAANTSWFAKVRSRLRDLVTRSIVQRWRRSGERSTTKTDEMKAVLNILDHVLKPELEKFMAFTLETIMQGRTKVLESILQSDKNDLNANSKVDRQSAELMIDAVILKLAAETQAIESYNKGKLSFEMANEAVFETKEAAKEIHLSENQLGNLRSHFEKLGEAQITAKANKAWNETYRAIAEKYAAERKGFEDNLNKIQNKIDTALNAKINELFKEMKDTGRLDSGKYKELVEKNTGELTKNVEKKLLEKNEIREQAEQQARDEIVLQENGGKKIFSVFEELQNTELKGNMESAKAAQFSIAYLQTAMKRLTAYETPLRVSQKMMVAELMFGNNIALKAGGGKTFGFIGFAGLAKIMTGNKLRHELLLEDSSAIEKYITDKEGKLGIEQKELAEAFGIELVNGNELSGEANKTGNYNKLIEALNNSDKVVLFDHTQRAHLGNPAVRNAALRKAMMRANLVAADEVHIMATSRTSAIIGGGQSPPQRWLVRRVDKVLKEFGFDYEISGKKEFTEFNDKVTNFLETSNGKIQMGKFTVIKDAYLEKPGKYNLEEYMNQNIFVITNIGIKANFKALNTLRQFRPSEISSVMRTLFSQRGKGSQLNSYDVIKEMGADKGKIAPVSEDGSLQRDQISNDIVGQITASRKHGGTPLEDVRVNYTEMQTNLTKAYDGISGLRIVGGTATVGGIRGLMQSQLGSRTTEISTSSLNLDAQVKYTGGKVLTSLGETLKLAIDAVTGKTRNSTLIFERDPAAQKELVRKMEGELRKSEFSDDIAGIGVQHSSGAGYYVRRGGNRVEALTEKLRDAMGKNKETGEYDFKEMTVAEMEKSGRYVSKDLVYIELMTQEPVQTIVANVKAFAKMKQRTVTIINEKAATGKNYQDRLTLIVRNAHELHSDLLTQLLYRTGRPGGETGTWDTTRYVHVDTKAMEVTLREALRRKAEVSSLWKEGFAEDVKAHKILESMNTKNIVENQKILSEALKVNSEFRQLEVVAESKRFTVQSVFQDAMVLKPLKTALQDAAGKSTEGVMDKAVKRMLNDHSQGADLELKLESGKDAAKLNNEYAVSTFKSSAEQASKAWGRVALDLINPLHLPGRLVKSPLSILEMGGLLLKSVGNAIKYKRAATKAKNWGEIAIKGKETVFTEAKDELNRQDVKQLLMIGRNVMKDVLSQDNAGVQARSLSSRIAVHRKAGVGNPDQTIAREEVKALRNEWQLSREKVNNDKMIQSGERSAQRAAIVLGADEDTMALLSQSKLSGGVKLQAEEDLLAGRMALAENFDDAMNMLKKDIYQKIQTADLYASQMREVATARVKAVMAEAVNNVKIDTNTVQAAIDDEREAIYFQNEIVGKLENTKISTQFGAKWNQFSIALQNIVRVSEKAGELTENSTLVYQGRTMNFAEVEQYLNRQMDVIRYFNQFARLKVSPAMQALIASRSTIQLTLRKMETAALETLIMQSPAARFKQKIQTGWGNTLRHMQQAKFIVPLLKVNKGNFVPTQASTLLIGAAAFALLGFTGLPTLGLASGLLLTPVLQPLFNQATRFMPGMMQAKAQAMSGRWTSMGSRLVSTVFTAVLLGALLGGPVGMVSAISATVGTIAEQGLIAKSENENRVTIQHQKPEAKGTVRQTEQQSVTQVHAEKTLVEVWKQKMDGKIADGSAAVNTLVELLKESRFGHIQLNVHQQAHHYGYMHLLASVFSLIPQALDSVHAIDLGADSITQPENIVGQSGSRIRIDRESIRFLDQRFSNQLFTQTIMAISSMFSDTEYNALEIKLQQNPYFKEYGQYAVVEFIKQYILDGESLKETIVQAEAAEVGWAMLTKTKNEKSSKVNIYQYLKGMFGGREFVEADLVEINQAMGELENTALPLMEKMAAQIESKETIRTDREILETSFEAQFGMTYASYNKMMNPSWLQRVLSKQIGQKILDGPNPRLAISRYGKILFGFGTALILAGGIVAGVLMSVTIPAVVGALVAIFGLAIALQGLLSWAMADQIAFNINPANAVIGRIRNAGFGFFDSVKQEQTQAAGVSTMQLLDNNQFMLAVEGLKVQGTKQMISENNRTRAIRAVFSHLVRIMESEIDQGMKIQLIREITQVLGFLKFDIDMHVKKFNNQFSVTMTPEVQPQALKHDYKIGRLIRRLKSLGVGININVAPGKQPKLKITGSAA